LGVTDAGVSHWHGGCVSTPFEAAVRYTDFLVSPPAPRVTWRPPTTGVAEVDAVLSAVARWDVDGLLGMVDFHFPACSNDRDRAGNSPWCPLGVPDGAQTKAFYSSTCRGHWVVEDTAREFVAVIVAREPVLHAVARRTAPGPAEADVAASRYTVVLESSLGWRSAVLINLAGGRITSIGPGCGSSAALQARGYTDFLIPPR
jgi:hypothetical protein